MTKSEKELFKIIDIYNRLGTIAAIDAVRGSNFTDAGFIDYMLAYKQSIGDTLIIAHAMLKYPK